MKRAIVVGSGIAGLIAALELSRAFDVTLVTKAKLAESNTRYAQGGIAAVMFDDDSVADHIADTLRAGAGLSNRAAVEILCAEGPARIRDLIALGVEFDRRDGELARGLEAAHSSARVLHAGGDATGLTIETALVRAVRKAPVRVLEDTFACDLLMQSGVVTGLEVLTPEGSRTSLFADAVVLASGGAGQLFLHTTNPSVATGDGVAIALRAGAEVADVEFYQFHPTALALPGSFLISEAVRGDGAVLRNASGERFMQALDPAAELAPRDVVARGIARTMAAQNGEPVLLDATALGEKFLRERFPTIDAACRARGLEWWRVPIPVTPAAHYWMGGIRTDLDGRTSLPALYAVGECACTGVHGANRLASNSLLESLVFAWRCAHLLLAGGVARAAEFPLGTIAGLVPASLAASGTGVAGVAPFTRQALQTLMWEQVGIERNAEGLRAAQQQIEAWSQITSMAGSTTGSTTGVLEDANLLTIGRVLVHAALAREESRGAHDRSDFPRRSAALEHSLVYEQSVATGQLEAAAC